MEIIALRFPHITDQIFELINNKSVTKCREVEKTWRRFIDEDDLPWKRILRKYPVETGQTPLHIAAMTGQLHKCEVLFYKNIYLHEDIQGITALHLSASYGHLKICELLMKGVREKLPKDQHGSTPLHEAAKRGYMKICELFMKNLEDKNPVNRVGQTPLHLAGENRHIMTCKIIIDNLEDNEDKICQCCTKKYKYHPNKKDVCHFIPNQIQNCFAYMPNFEKLAKRFKIG